MMNILKQNFLSILAIITGIQFGVGMCSALLISSMTFLVWLGIIQLICCITSSWISIKYANRRPDFCWTICICNITFTPIITTMWPKMVIFTNAVSTITFLYATYRLFCTVKDYDDEDED